jgi:hypothetical protein
VGKKQYYLIVDTETTITDKVADFGAVICDRNGVIFTQCGVLIQSVFGVDPLFYNTDSSGLWAKASIDRRMDNYNAMLHSGTRMLASVNAVNRWLEKAVGKYNPILTAYNLAFDNSKCANTQIDLSMFSDRFCLWAASIGNICNSKAYKQFILENHLFKNPTSLGNMSWKTSAEAVTGFLRGEYTDEPHTSIEDIIGYELPTLVHILKKKGWKDKVTPYDWRKHQVKDFFGVK